MLMARQPAESESRRAALTSRIQLPDFKTFLSTAGQPDHASASHTRAIPPTTEPSEYLQRRPSIFESSGPPTGSTYQHQPPPYPPPPHDYRPAPPSRESHQAPAINSGRYNYAPPEPVRTPAHSSHVGYPELRSPAGGNFPKNPHSKIVIREEMVEGKGLCYIYNDNTHCPKLVNGDVVNPKWGTTKAGKPRKRLGQACNTCREKKIRCDPHVPKCAQCQKFGRECKFEPSARGSQRSTRGSSPGDSSPAPDRQGSVQHDRTGSDTSTERAGGLRAARSSISVEHLLSPTSTHSPGSQGSPPGKRRKYFDSPSRDAREGAAMHPAQHSRSFSPETDPHRVDPHMTHHYLSEFFAHFNEQLYHLFPQQRFQEWVRSEQNKSSSDRLLLYAMLTVGTVFSQTPARQQHRQMFLDIAERCLDAEARAPTLQLVQSLLLLTMFRFSRGQAGEARDTSSSLVRLAYDLSLNREPDGHTVTCFGLDRNTFDECRRRTFWVAYCIDSLLQYCAPHNGLPAGVDCELRTPCREALYEAGTIPELQITAFRGMESHQVQLQGDVGLMAHVLAGFAIFREIASWPQYLRHMTASQVQASHTDFQKRMDRRLNQWKTGAVAFVTRKPPAHRSPPGAECESESEPCEMLILYHLCKMILHRHIRFDCMTREQVDVNCREARSHAYQLLDMLHQLHERGHADDSPVVTACPGVGYAVILAIDMITAAGSIFSVVDSALGKDESLLSNGRGEGRSQQAFLDLISAGIETLDGLSPYWETAKQQGKAVQARVGSVLMAPRNCPSGHKAGYFVREPLYSPYGVDMDVIYGLSKVVLFKALGMGDKITSESDLYEVEGAQSLQ